mmetsp:Transcript_26298/g.42487  ORF Transcript_26298/g.42487 Transcript_26298/m.42487 type:complete len:310 (-) Transcript_26298:53-982(-)
MQPYRSGHSTPTSILRHLLQLLVADGAGNHELGRVRSAHGVGLVINNPEFARGQKRASVVFGGIATRKFPAVNVGALKFMEEREDLPPPVQDEPLHISKHIRPFVVDHLKLNRSEISCFDSQASRARDREGLDHGVRDKERRPRVRRIKISNSVSREQETASILVPCICPKNGVARISLQNVLSVEEANEVSISRSIIERSSTRPRRYYCPSCFPLPRHTLMLRRSAAQAPALRVGKGLDSIVLASNTITRFRVRQEEQLLAWHPSGDLAPSSLSALQCRAKASQKREEVRQLLFLKRGGLRIRLLTPC